MDPRSDEELIRLHKDGDAGAFSALLKRHLQEMYNFALRLGGAQDADDIVQEVFIKIWKNIAKFDRTHSQFRTWLYSIARNTTIDFLRKKKQIPFSDFDGKDGANPFVEGLADDAPLASETLAKAQDEKIVEEALLSLEPRAREVLLLRYRQGFTFEEIGGMLHEPLNTVKSRHRRALFTLKDAVLRRTKNESGGVY